MASQEVDFSQFVTMNMAGRFSGPEIKRYGQRVIKHILTEKDIGLFFGQQTNFRPSISKYHEYIGNTRAFLLYNRKQFKVCDEKQYRHYIRDLEVQGRIPRHYLPESNFVICKVKTRSYNRPRAEFIAISWLTDECMGKLKASSQMKKLLLFMDNLSAIEQLPVIVGGTFRVPLDDAKELMNDQFRCCGYLPANKRREVRSSSFYLCSRSLKLTDVKPIVCAKIDLTENDNERWLNPEDAFYWDPVIASFVRRGDQNFPVSRPQSPEVIVEADVISTAVTQTEVKLVKPPSREQNGQNGQMNGEGLKVHDEVDEGVIRRIPSYVELYDEELMETNADDGGQLPVIWKLERIHFLLIAFIDELQNIQIEMEKPKIADGSKQVATVWY